MTAQLRPLIVIIVLLGALAYTGGIVWAGIASIKSEEAPDLPDIVTQAITSIGAALATHFGALFGISQFTGGNPRPIPKVFQIHTWATLPRRPKKRPEFDISEELLPGHAVGEVEKEPTEKEPTEAEHKFDFLQIAAAYLYFGSLILAAVFWLLDDSFSAKSADIIKTMSSSLVGVIAGVIAIVLNVKKPTP